MSDMTLYIWSDSFIKAQDALIIRFCHDGHTDIAHIKILYNINIQTVQLN